MKYGIIADIHGNLEAFEAVIEALLRDKINDCVCVGDIVGYGANPAECIKLVQKAASSIVCGNHDEGAAGWMDMAYFNKTAREAIEWTRRILSKEDILFLQKLGLTCKNRIFTLAHGTLDCPEAFHYMFDEDVARRTFDLMDNRVCFVGHTHKPRIFSQRNNKITLINKNKAKISKNEKIIVDVGSVGQPRDGDSRASYCVYDTKSGLIELKRCEYNVDKAGEKIVKAGLPLFLAERLTVGI